MKIQRLFLLVAVATSALYCAQTPALADSAPPQRAWAKFDLATADQTVMRSAAGEDYRIVVVPPPGPPPKNGYPVIYVVDGNAWTILISEIVRTNVTWGVQSEVEPAVVVGIGYPINDAFDIERRTVDLTPPTPDDYPGIPQVGGRHAGGDVALMDFIDGVVKPAIEERFPIDRGRQTLAGHSLGGLFTLRTLFQRPTSFQNYVAISPSLWWTRDAVLADARRFAEAPDRPTGRRVFLAAGRLEQYSTPAYDMRRKAVLRRREERAGRPADEIASADPKSRPPRIKIEMVESPRKVAKFLTAAGIETEFVQFPDEDHFSVLPSAFGRGIPFALERPAPVARP